MSELECWTAADRAELDLLIYELARVFKIHVPACETCNTGGPWCSRMRDSFEAIIDWRQARELRSKATWLRLQEIERERAPGRGHIAFDEHGEVVEFEIRPMGEQAAA